MAHTPLLMGKTIGFVYENVKNNLTKNYHRLRSETWQSTIKKSL